MNMTKARMIEVLAVAAKRLRLGVRGELTADELDEVRATLEGKTECPPRGAPMTLAVALNFADDPRPYNSLTCPADTPEELYEALRVLAQEYRALLQKDQS